MLTLFIESIKIKNPCQIKPQNLYDKDYQRFIKELGFLNSQQSLKAGGALFDSCAAQVVLAPM